MALRIVPLEAPRATGKDGRIATARRLPHGMPAIAFSSRNGYKAQDPELSPGPTAMAIALQSPHARRRADCQSHQAVDAVCST